MRAQARDLVAVEIGHAQRMAVRGRPDGLHHVPEVEAAGGERVVPQDGERGEAGDPGCGPRNEQDESTREGDASHSSRSMMPRHRGPRTASLARCS